MNFISSSNSDNPLALQDTSAQCSYYQRLIYSLLLRSIHTVEGFESLGRQLVDIVHHAYLVRQMETVDQVSQMMLALPISKHLKGIAHYYQAIYAKRKGDFDDAHRLLESIVGEVPQQYRARVLLTIGATYFDSSEVEAALPFYLTARQASRESDLLTLLESQRNIAVIRSVHGDHKQALEDIENLFSLVRIIGKHYPTLYYDYLNSLAVELGEVGRINEARNVCQITLASPFAAAYPNWLETRDELEAKRTARTPSIIAVSVALEPEAQPSRRVKPTLSVASACECVFIQRSVAIVVMTVAPVETGTNILDRVEHSIRPRGPPARF